MIDQMTASGKSIIFWKVLVFILNTHVLNNEEEFLLCFPTSTKVYITLYTLRMYKSMGSITHFEP